VVTKSARYDRTGGSPKNVLLPGQVVVREGTTNVTLSVRHWPRLLARYTEQVKADTRRDIDALVGRLVDLQNRADSGTLGATPIDLEMDTATFGTASAAVIESGSPSRLDAVLREADERLRAYSTEPSDDEARAATLDRLFVLGLAAMLCGTERQFQRVMEVIENYYDSVPRLPHAVRHTTPHERASTEAWRDVAVRLFVLGAEAVRREKWPQLRRITLHRYDSSDAYGYVSWIRHANTSAARADVLDEPGQLQKAAIISRAMNAIATTPGLAPDLTSGLTTAAAVLEGSPALDALCQFDVLWCTIAFSVSRSSHDFYPSSAGFEQQHAYPAFDGLVRDQPMRRALFPGMSDAEIAEAVTVVAESAQRQSAVLPGFDWWGELPDSVTKWIALV